MTCKSWRMRSLGGKWTRLLLLALVLLLPALRLEAWGPHQDITRVALAALAAMPEAARWRAELGAGVIDGLTTYCLMPDMAKAEAADFYIDDYLLIRGAPMYVGHCMPAVHGALEPYFRRAIQGLRTETPLSAVRQIGPILHYVEDCGAPPHTGPGIPDHGPLENWVKAEEIAIPGYRPQLLGATDEEALAEFMKRVDGLIAFSAQRCARAAPLVKKGEGARPEVEPILLESANESARVSADLLYTLFSLGLRPQQAGAVLGGTIEAPAYFRNNAKGARIILLDAARYDAAREAAASGRFADCATDFTTVAASAAAVADAAAWRGEFRFRNLPPGAYRVLAYRPGARWRVSDPVTLKAGETAEVSLRLAPAEPAGNIIQNPDGRLAYLAGSPPDRWQQTSYQWGTARKPRVWASATAVVAGPATCRCGAVLKDPEAKVRFDFGKLGGADLPSGQPNPAETRFKVEGRAAVVVLVETAKPFNQAVERVWVVPEEEVRAGVK